MSLSLTLPTVGSTPGTEAATMINTALTAVQNTFNAHAHTGGDGTKVKPAGMEINESLSFIDSLAVQHGSTGMKFCGFSTQASAPSFGHGLFVLNDDLYYNNGTIDLAITSGGAPLTQPNGLTDSYNMITPNTGKLGFISGGNLYRFTTGNLGDAASSALAPINTKTILETDSGNLVIDAPLTVDIGSAGGAITLDSGFNVEITAFTDIKLTTGATQDLNLVGGTNGANGCDLDGGGSNLRVSRNITLAAVTSLIGSGRNYTLTANNGNGTLAANGGDIILDPGTPLTANYCTLTANTILITDNEIDPGNLETVDVGHRNRQNCISARATFDVVALTSVTPRANRWNVASGAYVTAGNYTVTLNEDIPSDASISVTSTTWGGPCFAVIASSGPTVIDVHFDAEVTAFSLIVVGA